VVIGATLTIAAVSAADNRLDGDMLAPTEVAVRVGLEHLPRDLMADPMGLRGPAAAQDMEVAAADATGVHAQ